MNVSQPSPVNRFTTGLVNALHERDSIRLFFHDGSQVETPYQDSFFLSKPDAEKLPREWQRHVVADGPGTVRVYWPEPIRAGGSRKGRFAYFKENVFDPKKITPLEADVDPVQRFLVETPGLEFSKAWRILFYDLETEPVEDWDKPWRSRILSFSWRLGSEAGHVRAADRTDAGERVLLQTFAKLADRADILVAWNGANFDDKVIRGRMDMVGVPFDPLLYHWIDHLKLFKRYFSRAEDGAVTSSFALGSISAALLGGTTKVPVEKRARELGWQGTGASHFVWVWEHAPDLLREYNDTDVDLMHRLEEKTGFLSLHIALTRLCRVLPSARSLFPMTLVDGRMLQQVAGTGYRFPSRREIEDEEGPKAKGAFVPEAQIGLHSNVAVLDFAKMYVSIIQSFNMSLETLDPAGPIQVPETDEMGRRTGRTLARFRLEPEGHLPAALRGVIELRKAYADRQKKAEVGSPEFREAERLSSACKVLGNTFYGVVLSPVSRLYRQEIGEAVTSVGRLLLASTIGVAEKRGHRLIFGDTDSVAITVKEEEEALALKDAVNRDMIPGLLQDAGIPPERRSVAIEYEKRYARVVVTASKRYAGRFALYKGKPATKEAPIDVRGLEIVRSDVCKAARGLQRRAIDLILDGTGAAELRVWAIEEMETFLKGGVPLDQLIMAKGITMRPDQYATKPAHVRLAERLEEKGDEIMPGSKIPFVHVIGGEIVHPEELLDQKLDLPTYWNKYVFPPTERVLRAAFPDGKWTIKDAGVPDTQLGLFLSRAAVNAPPAPVNTRPVRQAVGVAPVNAPPAPVNTRPIRQAVATAISRPVRPVRKVSMASAADADQARFAAAHPELYGPSVRPVRKAAKRPTLHLTFTEALEPERLYDLLRAFPGELALTFTVRIKEPGAEVDMRAPQTVADPAATPKLALGLRSLGASWSMR